MVFVEGSAKSRPMRLLVLHCVLYNIMCVQVIGQ